MFRRYQAAEKLGFAAKAVKGPFEALAQVPLPAVARVKTDEDLGHFVVLHRVRKSWSSWPTRPAASRR